MVIHTEAGVDQSVIMDLDNTHNNLMRRLESDANAADLILLFREEMTKKYPQETLNKSALWQVINGGAINPENTEYDLPEGEIEYFLKEFLQE